MFNVPECTIEWTAASEVSVQLDQCHYVPGQELEAARNFRQSANMKVVRLSALRNGRLYPSGIFLVLISVRG